VEGERSGEGFERVEEAYEMGKASSGDKGSVRAEVYEV